jgi:hypothetical protein
MDNQASKDIKKFLTKKQCDNLLVEPNSHRVNAAGRAIQTFKAHFISALAQLIATSYCNCGITSHHKLKPPSTYWVHLALIQACLRTKPCTDHMIGTIFCWPHPGARQLFTKPPNPEDPGQAMAQMHGTLAHHWTTTDATISLYLMPALIGVPGQPNCFPSIVKSRFYCETKNCKKSSMS